MFETLINTSNIELKIWRRNPGGEAFWDSFKFPWRRLDQSIANCNRLLYREQFLLLFSTISP